MIDRQRRKILGTLLRQARKKSGRSTHDVAKLLRCSQPQVTRIELGQRSVDTTELPELAAAYDLQADELMATFSRKVKRRK